MRKGTFVALIVMLYTILTSACTNTLKGQAPSYSSDEQKQQPLHVLYATNEAGSEAIISAIETYSKQTGTPVEVETLPYSSLQEKVFSELAQRSSYYDLMALDTPWMPKVLQHLEPLSSYIGHTTRPNSIQLSDFIPKVLLDTSVYNRNDPKAEPPRLDTVSLEAVVSAGYDIWSLPIQSNVLTVSYRKDLFEDPKYQEEFRSVYHRGLTIPQTLEEYLDIAKFFTRDMDHDGKVDLYGTTLMASKHEANFVDFKSFLSVYGGKLFDDKLRPAFHTDVGVKALEAYGSWINRYKVTPPNVLTYTWDEVSIMFGLGQVAMGMNYHNMNLDPRVKGGQVGYFMFPGERAEDGTLVRGPHFGSWGIALSRYSQRKKEAYNLAEYITSPDVQIKYLPYNQHVTRKSAYQYSLHVEDASLREYYKVLGDSLNVGIGRPRIINYDQVSDAIQTAIHDYLTGNQTAETALTEAAANVELLMKQAGYNRE